MKIMIGVPTQEVARRADFYDYFNTLEKPEGTMITGAHGQSPARNRNMIISQALEQNCTHVFFLDDDVAFQSDLLMRLLAHNKDIVSGYYLMRNYPHMPILFDIAQNDGKCRHYFPPDEQNGLIEAVAFGLGACLIKIDVFKAMIEESKDKTWIRLGELEKDHWCDDIGFFNRARAYGFKLYCDLNARVGHMAHCTIWPSYKDGRWMVEYDTNSQHGRVGFLALRPVNANPETQPV